MKQHWGWIKRKKEKKKFQTWSVSNSFHTAVLHKRCKLFISRHTNVVYDISMYEQGGPAPITRRCCETNFKCIQQVMYMYLSPPKDPCDVGTPVAPEEKNIVDMPAMDFCVFLFFISIFIFLFFQLEAFSWIEFCEGCFGEKTLTAIIRFTVISSAGRINWAGISGMIWCKTNTLSPGACKYCSGLFPWFIQVCFSLCSPLLTCMLIRNTE